MDCGADGRDGKWREVADSRHSGDWSVGGLFITIPMRTLTLPSNGGHMPLAYAKYDRNRDRT